MKSLDGPPGPDDDFTDLHAWAEVYLPGAGWVGLDPTSGLFAGEGHIPLAATPEPHSAAPVSGLVSPCEVEFHHEMTRDAHPRRSARHQALHRRAVARDSGARRSRRRGARSGRRPPDDGRRADVRLDRRHGRRGVEHGRARAHTSSAWPASCCDACASSSPPAACCISARANGIPASRCRAGRSPATGAPTACRSGTIRSGSADPARDYGFGAADAQRFAEALARRLAVDPDYVIPAYEDPLDYILQGARACRSTSIRWTTSWTIRKSASACAASSSAASSQPVGFVLPLQRGHGKNGPEWQTGLWMLRGAASVPDARRFAGRLAPAAAEPAVGSRRRTRRSAWTVDPHGARGPLPVPRARIAAIAPPAVQPRKRPSATACRRCGESAPWIVRTALCVEPRDGRLHVFMPPVDVGRRLPRPARRHRRHRRASRTCRS